MVIKILRSVARVRPPNVGVILSLTGLGCMVAAAWTVGTALGLVVLGVSCWLAEWRLMA